MATIGYIRDCRTVRATTAQHNAIKRAGCDRIYRDKRDAVRRAQFTRAVCGLSTGDTLIIWTLDRIGKSVETLLMIIQGLSMRGVRLVSLKDDLDTSQPDSFYRLCAVLTKYVDGVNDETRKKRRATAKARGQIGGRPHKVTPELLTQAVRLLIDGKMSAEEIAEFVGVSDATFRRRVLPYYDALKAEGLAQAVKRRVG